MRGLDVVGTTEQLEHVATLIPDEWLAPSATGTPEQCVAAVRGQFDLGCDGVIMHGASPAELTPILEAYRLTAHRSRRGSDAGPWLTRLRDPV